MVVTTALFGATLSVKVAGPIWPRYLMVAPILRSKMRLPALFSQKLEVPGSVSLGTRFVTNNGTTLTLLLNPW